MFAARYFPAHYFALRFFPGGTTTLVPIAQEPMVSWATAITGISGLVDLLAEDAEGNVWATYNEPPDSDKNFPKLIWDDLTRANPPIDVENYLAQNRTLQVSLVIQEGQDPDTILSKIDEMREAWWGGAMDTAHWKILGIYRPGGWQRIDWEQRLIEGFSLVQYTADFIYRFNRKQNVA